MAFTQWNNLEDKIIPLHKGLLLIKKFNKKTMNKKLIITSILTALLALPAAVMAFVPPPLPNTPLIITPSTIIDAFFTFIWPIVAAFTVVMFIIAGFKFFTSQGNPQKVDEARQAVIWGVVGTLVVLLSFSFISLVRLAFGL